MQFDYFSKLLQKMHNKMKSKTINTTLSEQYQNPIEKPYKNSKWIPLPHIHDCSISWLGTILPCIRHILNTDVFQLICSMVKQNKKLNI